MVTHQQDELIINHYNEEGWLTRMEKINKDYTTTKLKQLG